MAGSAAAVTPAGQAPSAEVRSDCSTYASVPIPPEADRGPIPKSFPGCASYRSYRGIGRPIDYSKSRACAWQERLAQQARLSQNPEQPTAWVVGGSLILADIYFNGAGVQRNIPLAMRFACESEPGMVKLAMPEVTKFNDPARAYGIFEFCHYAATTFTMNFCGTYESEIADDRRARYYDSLISSMTTDQKTAFESLLRAQNAYVTAHALEVDQGGTIRSLRTLGSKDILNDLFRTEIVHFEKKMWPVLSDSQVATADDLLRRQYESTHQRLQNRPKEDSYGGAVTADNLSRVEESWNGYRDAWVAFARLRYPAAIAAIRAEITLRRYALLKTIS
jgi:uncharacterized protein YecT (DUF1311 family)